MNKKFVLFLKYLRQFFLNKNLVGPIRFKVRNRWGLNIKIFNIFSLKTGYAKLIIKTVLLKNIFIYLCLYMIQFACKPNNILVWCQYLLFNKVKELVCLNKRYIKELLFISDYGNRVLVAPFRRKWLVKEMFRLRKKLSKRFLNILKQQSKRFLKIFKRAKLQKRFLNLSKLKKISSISILNHKILKTFVNQLLFKRRLISKLSWRFSLRKYKNAHYGNKFYHNVYKLILKIKKVRGLSTNLLKKKLWISYKKYLRKKNGLLRKKKSFLINGNDFSKLKAYLLSKIGCVNKKTKRAKLFKDKTKVKNLVSMPIKKSLKLTSKPIFKLPSIKVILKKIKIFLIKFFKFFKNSSKQLSCKRLVQINNKIKQVFLINNDIVILLKNFYHLQSNKNWNQYQNFKLVRKIETNFKKLYKLYNFLKFIYKKFKWYNSVIFKKGIPFFRFFKSKNKFYIRLKKKKLYIRLFINNNLCKPMFAESSVVKNGMKYFQLLKIKNNVYICFKKKVFLLNFINRRLAHKCGILNKTEPYPSKWWKTHAYWSRKLRGPWSKSQPDEFIVKFISNPFIEKQISPLVFEDFMSYYFGKIGASIEAKENEKVYEWANRTRIPTRKMRNRMRWILPKH